MELFWNGLNHGLYVVGLVCGFGAGLMVIVVITIIVDALLKKHNRRWGNR